jgi:uncharacterized protein (TIGR02271 family)
MISETQARDVLGSTAYTHDGDKLGKVGHLFLDDETGRPEFVSINTGLFGTKESFVPVADADFDGDRLTVPFSTDMVKDAPNVDADSGHLDHGDEDILFEYYGMGGTSTGAEWDDLGRDSLREEDQDDQTDQAVVGHDTSGPTTDDAMTLSEERVNVDTTSQEAGRVRLRKYVTTETETLTVPVRKEKAVLEREPITDDNTADATSGPAISEEEHEVILHEERPVIDKTVESVERVRLGTETTVQDETVTESVRKEHVETEGDVDDRR